MEKYYFTYEDIHRTAKSIADRVEASGFEPDIIVAIGSGGFIPARILRTFLGKPILAVGGGGYHIPNTVRGWALCWSALVGDHSHQHDLGVGMGGVMLENTDWLGGLRDRTLLSDGGRRGDIDAEVHRVVDAVRAHVFPFHGLP